MYKFIIHINHPSFVPKYREAVAHLLNQLSSATIDHHYGEQEYMSNGKSCWKNVTLVKCDREDANVIRWVLDDGLWEEIL